MKQELKVCMLFMGTTGLKYFRLIRVYPQVFSGFYFLAFARVRILGRKNN